MLLKHKDTIISIERTVYRSVPLIGPPFWTLHPA